MTLREFYIPNLAEAVSELTVHSQHRITEITRRDTLKILNCLDSLFNDIDLFEGLNIVSYEYLTYDGIDNHLNFLPTLSKEIIQHYVRNPDDSNEEVLIRCGALTCSQTKFFALLEKLLHPIVRRGDEQTELAAHLNAVLRPDGFHATIIGEQSTYPIYAVRRIENGVAGAVKNLIFASIGPKPELVLRDAVNNDIEIIKHADKCLVFDRQLSASGLTWLDMAEWWQERGNLADLKFARQALGKRLTQSVVLSDSPGEYAIFRIYHEVLGPKFGDRLPALIPQVYLHYDPFTQSERAKLGKDSVLSRQRMDFLMLLDGRIRVVIEVDGQQHYSESGKASPTQYAKMVEEDRRLRLQGYELYRFGGAEFPDVTKRNDRYDVGPRAKKLVIDFFECLFDRHKIRP
ncbi:hypothetical protein ACO0LL_02330 [Undibacterium sp. TC4M20W]|uniref:AbiJ-related protein n=1 Tax=Undibacterium sp. TC4M20W TaxID=3413052 RepID=UPI003BF36BEC